MLTFSANTKMADVIHGNYILIPVIRRFGIKFGFGNKSVSDVCNQYNINEEFFLEIINSFHNKDYFPDQKLQKFSSKLIIDYLSQTHKYFREIKIPEIQNNINLLEAGVLEQNVKNIKLINNFFKEYTKELFIHLEHEDKEIFPYIVKLRNAIKKKQASPELIESIRIKPIEKYQDHHDNMEEKLTDLKNLIIRFLPPVICQECCEKVLIELYRLEDDLNNHSMIEDKVLVPKVKLMEKEVLNYHE